MSYLAGVPSEIISTFKHILSILFSHGRFIVPISTVSGPPQRNSPNSDSWSRGLPPPWLTLRFEGLLGLPTNIWKSSTSWINLALGSASAPPERNSDPSDEKSRTSLWPEGPAHQTTIQRLMNHPALSDPMRKPRNPIVLCHGKLSSYLSHMYTLLPEANGFLSENILCPGLYGFDVWGPSQFRRHYWSDILHILRITVGAEVLVTSVPPTGSIEERAVMLDKVLQEKARGRSVNFMAHSMGGLDCRQLITHIRPTTYGPLSLTSIATPHRGSPFMDWCCLNIGIGKPAQNSFVPYTLKSPLLVRELPGMNPEPGPSINVASSSTSPSTFTPLLNYITSLPRSMSTLILSLIDSPAYANLTTSYLNDYFNPRTPNRKDVKYFSVAGRCNEMSVFHPLWFPKLIVDKSEQAEREAMTSTKAKRTSTSTPTKAPPPARPIKLTSSKGKIIQTPPSLSAKRLRKANKSVSNREWGNDGLVPISSAKWGEYLGTVEDCNHWDIRGASGFSAAWESAGEAGGLGWTHGVDWSKFGLGSTKPRPPAENKSNLLTASSKKRDDEANKTAVWIGEEMAKANPPEPDYFAQMRDAYYSGIAEEEAREKAKQKEFNLNRLYIALSRKLYDEGL
ncbi:hypothetical protein FRB99_002513 [Tulasnella sp. 403]|nr:hypothetical protein FRB99_002513 [Tulasnella sp. 403]